MGVLLVIVVFLNPVTRANRDQRVDAALEGAIDDFLAVFVEAIRGDMTMTIEPHALGHRVAQAEKQSLGDHLRVGVSLNEVAS